MKATWDKILAIDLTSVKTNYLRRKTWWQRRKLRKKVNFYEYEYRKFLYLVCMNPQQCIVPWYEELDNLWHEHILDTRKYEIDCRNIFGSIIHHNPNLPKGTVNHTNHWAETKRLLKVWFK